MFTRMRNFLRDGLLAPVREFWRHATGESACDRPQEYQLDRLPYIEAMLPVTGVVTPVIFPRVGAQKKLPPQRIL